MNCSKSPEQPEGVEIVADSDVQQMLNQCSRDAPEKGESTWQPAASDVREFEAKLAVQLPHQLKKLNWLSRGEEDQLDKFPDGFWREYVGIVRDGRRYIYGNFGPVFDSDLTAGAAMEGPTDICDGGPRFFGAEYEIDSEIITHWGFNGPLG